VTRRPLTGDLAPASSGQTRNAQSDAVPRVAGIHDQRGLGPGRRWRACDRFWPATSHWFVDLGVSPVSNCYVKPQPVDMISADPRTISSRVAWVMAVVALLAAALAGAITVAVQYRGEVAALRRQLRSVPASHPASTVPLTLSSRTVALPSYGALNGEVTVFSAKFSGGLARIMPSARISGGMPYTSYALTGFDCAGSSGYQTWAAGVTGADGTGNLSGHALTVSLSDEYWLYLSPSSSGGDLGPGLDGSFTAAGKFSASPAGNPACP